MSEFRTGVRLPPDQPVRLEHVIHLARYAARENGANAEGLPKVSIDGDMLILTWGQSDG